MDYKVKFYRNSKNNKSPVSGYLNSLNEKDSSKILKYIEFLRASEGYLDEPYSKHIEGKIRELRVDFLNNRHRIFYFTFIKKTIVILYFFLKKTPKTPNNEIIKAKDNYIDVINNPKLYE